MARTLWLCLLLWGGVASAEPLRVCQQVDGSLSIVVWSKESLARPDAQRLTPVALQGLSCQDIDRSALPTDRARRDAWRLKANGKIEPDATIETKQEKAKRIRTTTRAKLKAGQALTDEELDTLGL